jgi:D-glycero-D-manno-heptose 1,7-bisphosphate phosphatase
MGRYSTDPSTVQPLNNMAVQPSYNSPYCPYSSSMGNNTIENQTQQVAPMAVIPAFKSIIGLDLNGVIIEDKPLYGLNSISIIPEALEGIRMMRDKGYRIFILSDQPNIQKGIISTSNIDEVFTRLMQIFGENGIYSIEGFLYNTSDIKEDIYAKPNLGMVKRAEDEFLKGSAKFKDGWYIGDSLVDLKYADKMDAKPVLVKTGNFEETLKKLETFSNKTLKSKTIIFNSLLEFANSLD